MSVGADVPGRNEPCWCGSGKKYKKCHLNRAAEQEIPFEALVQEMRSAWVHKKCSHPRAAPDACDRIVSAHTIQRSRVLQKIVNSSNHVSTFHPLDIAFSTNSFKLKRIGWKAASTFTGFCGRHDSATFKSLEGSDFVGSSEQCFLIGYRALCHEIYQKSGLIRSYPRMRDLVDRGLLPEHQHVLQAYWADLNCSAQKSLKDLQKLKMEADEQLLTMQYSGWKNAVIHCSGDLCVASTGVVSPNRDMAGNALQVLHDQDSDIQQLPFGIEATADGGAAVFTWRTSDAAPNQFVQSLLANDKRKLPHLLVQFIFAFIENTYFSEDWWNSLSPVNRDHLATLAGMGNPSYSDLRWSPSLKFVPWKVLAVVVS
jgi:hypothetical protein